MIICGGSNSYVDALLKNYNLENIGRENTFEHLPNVEVYSNLFELDGEEALKSGKKNKCTLTSASEIINSKNILKSDISKFNNKIIIFYFIVVFANI